MLKLLAAMLLLVILLVLQQTLYKPESTGSFYQVEQPEDDDGGSLTIYCYTNHVITGKLLIAGGHSSRNSFVKLSQVQLQSLFAAASTAAAKPFFKSITLTRALIILQITNPAINRPDTFTYKGQRIPALKPVE